MGIGFDCGTYNLVCCARDEKGNFANVREVNAFLEFPMTDPPIVYNMMDTAKVPIIKRTNVFYALGEKAVQIAYHMPGQELKRPMKDGCVNPSEKDAFDIMNSMMHSMLDAQVKRDDILYYSVPANAINIETDADYHSKVLDAIFTAYQSDAGHKIKPHPINEGLALVYAEFSDRAYTGIGISFGAGMVNLCFAMFGAPIFQFALVNSGDWIDRMAAKATGDSPTFINQEKTKVDLSKPPVSMVERAIQTQYRIMIEKTINGIKKGITDVGKKARTDKPIDIVIAGGTSLPNGFDVLFKEVLAQANLPIEVGQIVRPADPLYSVARGCLIAAENATK